MAYSVDPGELLWSWLHLSDIHFGHGSDEDRADQEDLIRQIVRDVSKIVARGELPRPQVLLLTGDIAYSGGLVRGASEYDEATALISDLRSAIGPDTPVYAVPGNHDVQRTSRKSSRAAYRLLYSLRNGTYGDDVIDESFNDDDEKNLLNERFANFTEFCETVGAPVAPGANGLWIERIPLDGGLHIQLIGINTALLANDDLDDKHLRVPYSTSTAAVKGISGDDIAFLMTHHPTSWLKSTDGANLEMKIRRDVKLHLHGHVHDPGTVAKAFGTGDGYLTITAGAVHADPSEKAAGVRNTYSFGALYRSHDSIVRLRVWPRTWDGGRWVRDTTQTPEHADFIELALPGYETSSPATNSILPTSETEALRSLALKSVDKVGRRRTAFPTDMSIAELYSADLVIPTVFGAKQSRAVDQVSVSEVVAAELNENLLLLGPPGAGKTVILYEFGQTLIRESDRIPIFIDITSFDSSGPDINEVSQIVGCDPYELTQSREDVVFIVDGIDEALAAGASGSEVGERLAALSSISRIIVSCRRNDYEFNLVAFVEIGLFGKIWYVHDWTTGQFHEFVDRLVAANLLLNNSLSQRVDSSPELQGLVRRPLLARMLTFLADDQELPIEQTALYSDYMTKLGLVSDSSANAAGCLNMPSGPALWQSISWLIFSQNLNPDSIKPTIIKQVAQEAAITQACARRVLDGVLDLNATTGTYVHYSFFEFLTALHIADELASKLPDDPNAVTGLLARDLPLEIRHHLARLLRQSGLDLRQWPEFFAEAYRSCADLDRSTSLVIRNMIVYLMCRLDVPADEPLLQLLRDEDETFLRNSLQWALTQHNNFAALDDYIAALAGDQTLASYNRGYLLYYYGDLPASVNPPHIDTAPYGSWNRTREALNEKYDGESYKEVATTRKAIDLYTFCDIAAARDQTLSESETARFSKLIEELDTAGLPAEAMTILRAQLERVTLSETDQDAR